MHGSNKTFSWRICLWVLIIVAVFYAAALLEIRPIAQAICPELEGDDDFGTFGDSTAVLNTFFSALAFGGVLITIFIQLAMTRRQAEENRISKFENVYFNMTQTFETIVDGLSKHISYNAAYPVENNPDNNGGASNNGDPYTYNVRHGYDGDSKYLKGRDVFQYVYKEEKIGDVGLTREEMLEMSENNPHDFDLISVVELHHYFRYLYRILKYIDDSELIYPLEKYEYAAMLRAQLSCYELVMLYYDGLSESGCNLKPLIEKYAMLDNLDTSLLATEYIHTSDGGYKESADNSDLAKNQLNRDGQSEEDLLQIATNVLLYCILPIAAIFFIQDKWYKYVVDVLFQHVPDENIPFMCLLVTGFALGCMEIYKRGNVFSKKWYSVEILLSLDALLVSIIAIRTMPDGYKWCGIGSFAYAALTPISALGYLTFWCYGNLRSSIEKNKVRVKGKIKGCVLWGIKVSDRLMHTRNKIIRK